MPRGPRAGARRAPGYRRERAVGGPSVVAVVDHFRAVGRVHALARFVDSHRFTQQAVDAGRRARVDERAPEPLGMRLQLDFIARLRDLLTVFIREFGVRIHEVRVESEALTEILVFELLWTRAHAHVDCVAVVSLPQWERWTSETFQVVSHRWPPDSRPIPRGRSHPDRPPNAHPEGRRIRPRQCPPGPRAAHRSRGFPSEFPGLDRPLHSGIRSIDGRAAARNYPRLGRGNTLLDRLGLPCLHTNRECPTIK